jgi:hypothetical protein
MRDQQREREKKEKRIAAVCSESDKEKRVFFFPRGVQEQIGGFSRSCLWCCKES